MWKYLLPIFLLACQGETVPSNHDDDDPVDEPWCENHEWEPNDDFFQADFITVLPTFTEECIEGLITSQYVDYFLFFLVPPSMDTEVVEVSLSVEILNEFTTPKVTFYQTEYDKEGNPTGGYTRLGEFIGADGWLLISNWPVRYDFLERNNLYVKLEAFAPPGVVADYKISVW